MYDYAAKLEQVTDGDTVRLTVDHGMHIRSSQAIRLLDVYAPESRDVGGFETRSFVAAWVFDHRHPRADGRPGPEWPLHVVTIKDATTFNRYIGTVTCSFCGQSLNADINVYVAAAGWGHGIGG